VSDRVFLRALADCIVGLAMERGGQGNTTRRRQDKSGSPVGIQALERACLSPCRAVGSRAAPGHKFSNINGNSGTIRFSRLGFCG
jgi:hypothetical protein